MRLTFVIMDVNGNTRPQVKPARCYSNRDGRKPVNLMQPVSVCLDRTQFKKALQGEMFILHHRATMDFNASILCCRFHALMFHF